MRRKENCPNCGGPANRYGWVHKRADNRAKVCALFGTSRIFYYRDIITRAGVRNLTEEEKEPSFIPNQRGST